MRGGEAAGAPSVGLWANGAKEAGEEKPCAKKDGTNDGAAEDKADWSGELGAGGEEAGGM
jgi:hypothetical protein